VSKYEYMEWEASGDRVYRKDDGSCWSSAVCPLSQVGGLIRILSEDGWECYAVYAAQYGSHWVFRKPLPEPAPAPTFEDINDNDAPKHGDWRDCPKGTYGNLTYGEFKDAYGNTVQLIEGMTIEAPHTLIVSDDEKEPFCLNVTLGSAAKLRDALQRFIDHKTYRGEIPHGRIR
jgi:hypothetical protein